MKKFIKSLLSLLIFTVILVLPSSQAHAGGRLAPCDMYGQHHMKSHAWGTVSDASTRSRYTGAAYRCDCGHVVIFERDCHPERFGISQCDGMRFATAPSYDNNTHYWMEVNTSTYNQRVNSSSILWTGYEWYSG